MVEMSVLRKLPTQLRIEIAENEHRKDFTEWEKAEQQAKIRDILSESTEQGRRTDLENETSSKNLDEVGRTDRKIATIYEESNAQIHKRLKVHDAVQKNPDEFGDLKEKLENSVHSAYNEYQRRKEKKEREEKTRNVPELKNLFCGNCLEKIEKIPDNAIDCLVTDPPYGIGEETGAREYTQKMRAGRWGYDGDDETIFPLLGNLFQKLEPKLKEDAHIYIFTSWKVWHKLYPIVDEFYEPSSWLGYLHYLATGGHFQGYRGGLSSILFAVNGEGRRISGDGWNFFDVAGERKKEQDHHPAQKSIGICKKLIQNSTVKGETVLDPFCGSGSTLVAAEELDRNWIGIEKENRWFEVAKSRIWEVRENGN